LASFMFGETGLSGISGLRVGAGKASWDTTPEAPVDSQVTLTDQNSWLVPKASLTLNYLDGNWNVAGGPTRTLQIQATLRAGVPPWPEQVPNPPHPSATLREFGLIGMRNNNTDEVLINVVHHAAIPKDPVSILQRTIWLVF